MITSVSVIPLSRRLIVELSSRILPDSAYGQMVDEAMVNITKSVACPDIVLGFASLIYAVEKRFIALQNKEEKLGELRYNHFTESDGLVIENATRNLNYIIGIGEAMSCIDILVNEFDQYTLNLVLPYITVRSVQLYLEISENSLELENELVN